MNQEKAECPGSFGAVCKLGTALFQGPIRCLCKMVLSAGLLWTGFFSALQLVEFIETADENSPHPVPSHPVQEHRGGSILEVWYP